MPAGVRSAARAKLVEAVGVGHQLIDGFDQRLPLPVVCPNSGGGSAGENGDDEDDDDDDADEPGSSGGKILCKGVQPHFVSSSQSTCRPCTRGQTR